MFWFKEAIRRVVFFGCWLAGSDGEFVATDGSLKFKFLSWLYDYDRPEPLPDHWC
jgi:hypothetical protein